ncbi:MAG: tripartite tricarboxylate transporter substrate binding protein [Betaproteobacteria bacterium]|nr:tripartite tricarboxylate transporter substrate binding protein [Betaproteobacteria bacterium]
MKTLFLFLVIAGATQLASAQEYPSKAIRVIIPFSPGSGLDVLGRLLTPKLHEATRQPVIAENRAGGAGRIGHEAVAKAAPDGYTLLLTAVGPLIHTPILYPQTPFDPLKDFAAISLFVTGPLVIVVHPSIPVKNVKELVDFAKKRPGQLNFGSTGVGSVNHLLGEMLNLLTGTKIVHVPYKGGADALTELLGGQVEMVMTGVSPVIPHAKAGKLRVIVTTGRQRMPNMPEVPTMAESGLPEAEIVIWYGAVAPAATPKHIIGRLNREIVKVMNLPDLRERYAQQSVVPETNSPEQFAQLIRDEYARWTKVIRTARIKLE